MPYKRGPLKGQLKLPEIKKLAKGKKLKINYNNIILNLIFLSNNIYILYLG